MISLTTQNSVSNAFFQKNITKLAAKFNEESNKIFRQSTLRFQDEQTENSLNYLQSGKNRQQPLEEKVRRTFRQYQEMKTQGKQKSAVMQQMAVRHYQQSLKRRLFQKLHLQSQNEKYQFNLEVMAKRFRYKSQLKSIVRRWHQMVIQKNRRVIEERNVEQSDSILLQKQEEYKQKISALEAVLTERLQELQVVEESHQRLYNRYETMTGNQGTLVSFDQ